MKDIDLQGADVDEIVAQFKAQHHLTDTDFTYKVINAPSKGFLGLFGKKPATVRFTVNNLTEDIKSFIDQMAKLTSVTIDEVLVSIDSHYIRVDLNGVSEPGFMIGKEGRYLLSLQYLLCQIFMGKDPQHRNVILDIDGYKVRQEAILFKKAQQLARKVIKTKTSVTMDAMNSSQRRVVHQAVKDMRGIKTMTIGEGAMKRVVLSPNGR